MSRVNRRHLISMIGGTLTVAGCLDQTDGSPNETSNRSEPDDSSNVSNDDNGTGRREMPPFDIPHARYALSVIDAADRTASFLPPYEKTELEKQGVLYCGIEATREATDEQPSGFRIFLFNFRGDEVVVRPYADEPRLRLLSGALPTLQYQNEGEEDVSLVLAPTERHSLAQRVPSFARTDDGIWYLEERERCLSEEIRIGGGELLEGQFALLASGRENGIRVGSYATEGAGDQPSVRLQVWQTSRPGVEPESRFDFSSVTPLGPFDDLADAHWYHDASPSTEIYVEPSTEHVETPAVVSFDAVNHSQEILEDETVAARLYKKVGNRVHPIPHGSGRASYDFPPGDRTTIAVGTAHNGDPPDVGETTASRRTIAVGYLGGGTYVLDAQVIRDGRTHAAAFDLDAPSVDLASHETANVDRSGAAVTVTMPTPEDAEQWESITVQRVDKASTQFVVEQVMQDDVLRTALSHFDDDAEQVTVRWPVKSGFGPKCDSFLPDDDTFRFDGRAFLFET